jgi:DoxX-like family
MHKIRPVAYWIATFTAAGEMLAGSVWDLLQIEYVRVVFAHLGYPRHLLLILGVWKLPCGLVLLLPGFPLLKEWAYAGAFFNYSGAVASHLLVGDRPRVWVWPLAFAMVTLTSWALRPLDRRPAARLGDASRPVEWIVPIGGAAAMLVVALLTLPKKPPSL